MSFLIWILQALFWALWLVSSKVLLKIKPIWNNLHTLFNRWIHAVLLIVLFWIWIFEYDIKSNPISSLEWFLLFVSSIASYFTYYLKRVAYVNEKVSTLQPFTMLAQILPIIFWFIFIASERVNIITFIMALIASFIVIWTSIDLKKFKINKYSLLVSLSSVIKSIQLFFVVYLLTKLNPVTYYFTESLILIALAIFFAFLRNDFWKIKTFTKKYSLILVFTNVVIMFSVLLILFMFSSLWIVATSLISLLYLVFLYIFSFFILKEVPSKRDIIITLFVVICIIIWTYFKS